jgi:phosphatidate phosphatase APP1
VPVLPRIVYRVAFEADARLSKTARAVERALGIHKPLRILPYRGFGTSARVVVKARVLEDRGMPSRSLSRGLVGGAIASAMRYNTTEIPNARVRVRWNGAEWEGATDDEGFLDLAVTPPPGIASGWHDVELRLTAPDEGLPLPRATARVLVVGDDAEYGVISDIDDTVIDTGVTNLAKRAWALFMTEAYARLPFEGVSALYAALERGGSGAAENPLVYVSSSPWNLYEHLEHFLEEHAIPAGPILLRDWGLRRDGFAPGGGHGHKLDKIRGVLAAFPGLSFVLVGDSGQEDARHYLTVVREHGARIRVVYIREVPTSAGRHLELARVARAMHEAGSELVLVKDSVAAAEDAARRGLVPKDAVARVAARRVEGDHA